MTQFYHLRSSSSGPEFVGTNQDDTVLWDTTERKWFTGPSPSALVISVFGRQGAVIGQSGDYGTDEIDNDSDVDGVTLTDALETLKAASGVTSFNERTGAVVPQEGDYDADIVDYAPTTAVDWGATPPANVATALDALARTNNLEQHAAGSLGAAATISFTTPAITPKRSGIYLVVAYICGTASGATNEALELLQDAVSIAQGSTGTGNSNKFCGALMAVAQVTTGATHTFTVRATTDVGTNTSASGEIRIVTLEIGG